MRNGLLRGARRRCRDAQGPGVGDRARGCGQCGRDGGRSLRTVPRAVDEINALADRSPGFVWRLQNAEGNATYLRPYDDERILFNMSLWETIEH